MSGLTYLKNVVTLQLSEAKCNACGMCIKVCPHEVFDIINGKAKVLNFDACMECGACAMNCAKKAITVRSGVGCAAGIINGMLRGTEASCDCSGQKSSCC
jgi:NAD-dependent dihydropyrimidine dehydrogenase PreA subunit